MFEQADALDAVARLMSQPMSDEVIVLTLDRRRRPVTALVVHAADDHDAVLVALAHAIDNYDDAGSVVSVVAASTRTDSGVVPDDIDRWFEACVIAESRDVELIEWFVMSADAVECPRDLIGQPARW
jgi:hypothetical protein